MRPGAVPGAAEGSWVGVPAVRKGQALGLEPVLVLQALVPVEPVALAQLVLVRAAVAVLVAAQVTGLALAEVLLEQQA